MFYARGPKRIFLHAESGAKSILSEQFPLPFFKTAISLSNGIPRSFLRFTFVSRRLLLLYSRTSARPTLPD